MNMSGGDHIFGIWSIDHPITNLLHFKSIVFEEYVFADSKNKSFIWYFNIFWISKNMLFVSSFLQKKKFNNISLASRKKEGVGHFLKTHVQTSVLTCFYISLLLRCITLCYSSTIGGSQKLIKQLSSLKLYVAELDIRENFRDSVTLFWGLNMVACCPYAIHGISWKHQAFNIKRLTFSSRFFACHKRPNILSRCRCRYKLSRAQLWHTCLF